MGGTFTYFVPFTSGTGLSAFMHVKNCLAIGYRYFANDKPYTLTSPITFRNCTFLMTTDYAGTSYGSGIGMIDIYDTLIW